MSFSIHFLLELIVLAMSRNAVTLYGTQHNRTKYREGMGRQSMILMKEHLTEQIYSD